MSKSVVIIRHAKSSWDSAVNDHQRSLNERGHTDASLVGEFVLQSNLILDAVYCSDAKRTRQTLHILNTSIQLPPNKIQYLSRLYLADLYELVALINATDATYENIAIIGHNPGLTELYNYLGSDQLKNLPTCSVSVVKLLVDDWQAVCEGSGINKLFCTPRMLKDVG